MDEVPLIENQQYSSFTNSRIKESVKLKLKEAATN